MSEIDRQDMARLDSTPRMGLHIREKGQTDLPSLKDGHVGLFSLRKPSLLVCLLVAFPPLFGQAAYVFGMCMFLGSTNHLEDPVTHSNQLEEAKVKARPSLWLQRLGFDL